MGYLVGGEVQISWRGPGHSRGGGLGLGELDQGAKGGWDHSQSEV